jgi:hypothetical protein
MMGLELTFMVLASHGKDGAAFICHVLRYPGKDYDLFDWLLVEEKTSGCVVERAQLPQGAHTSFWVEPDEELDNRLRDCGEPGWLRQTPYGEPLIRLTAETISSYADQCYGEAGTTLLDFIGTYCAGSDVILYWH